MELLPGLLLAVLCRAATAAEGECWSDVSKSFHPDGTTGFYQCKQYTCTAGEWEATGVTDPDCDIFADGCWSPTVHKMMPFGTKGYYKCDQMECKPDKTWTPTGERLPNCPAGSMACWDWMQNATVPVDSTMYFECNQYLCTEYDFMQNGERDPTCETNGCFSVITQEVVPYGVKGYWKCDQMECMNDKTWKPTGEKLPGCSESSIVCWDWMKNETVPIGSSMDYKQYSYKCTENDWEQTGPINLEQCTEGQRWKQDCNECICRNGQGVCTTRACIPGDWPQRGQTLPSGADCSDGSSFKQECNDCTCSNGRIVCTMKACLPNYEHPANTVLCKEGSLWKTDDCNTCRCRDNKQLCTRRLCSNGSPVLPGLAQIGVMPLGASVLQQPMEKKTEPECQIEEGSTDRYRQECNWCRCLNGKGVCTRRGCNPEINERLESEPNCEGTIMFKKDCNWCSCVDGRAICTFRACLPGSSGRPQTHSATSFAMAHRTRAQPPGSQANKNEILCTAGSVWRIKCNRYRCIDGKGVGTKMACRPGPDRDESPVCEGESSWKIKCNWCNCTNGQAECTRRVCSSRPFIPREPDVASISNTEEECTEGSNWRRDCNWCRCVKGKGVCTRRACIPEIGNQFDDKPECVGEARWKVNCNWCSCRDSKALCTLKACLPAHTSPTAIGVIKDDEPECSEGSKWMNSCNQCQCRNGKESCSKKACPPPQVMSASDRSECEGNSQWRKDCNLCQCVEGRAVCTLRACLTPARPSTGLSSSNTDSDIDCEEGARWRKDCNWCSCMKGRGGCTKKGCQALPGTVPVWNSLPECEGTSRFKKDCNWCTCQDGIAVCTEMACLPADFRSPSSSDAQCLDGSTWKNECNSCFCSNGIAACTMMMCLPNFKPSDTEEECSPGAFWKKDCNTCRCLNGKGVCTRRACFPGVAQSPANDLCSLPAIAPGAKVCGGFMRKWTFNSEAGECQNIVYGGCGGTENLFSTIEECQTACKSSQGVAQFRSAGNRPESCKLPMESGPCFASKTKFAFNSTSNRCERFFYGGCQGNANKFNSAQECSDECGGDPPVFDAGCDRSKCQWSRWSHYTSKGCLPQYDNGACCPTSFTCPSKGPSDPNICHYRGKDYAIGDEVPIAEDCETACRCAPGFSPGAGAEVRCASIECPDLFRAPEPNCRQLYRTGECCSYSKDCQDPDSPPQLESKLVTCEWNNKTYREGDRMYFDGEYNCQKCICSRDFNGPTGAGCDLITCGFDFRYSSKLQKGCTPIFFEDKCCPIDWMCPGDSRVASQPQSPAIRGDIMKCTMGDLSLEVGATLELNERNCDTKCSCLTPPEFTCVKHRDCDLANGEQNSPQIAVRRGNLDCPLVNCGDDCALLTDLRTGCHFCSCGADVVTCPELRCHESCHTVQDTNSGCPRCECNCPKDPLGNPPCPMDCAIHFVKDPATGCEKCECTPGSSSPFPRPIPLPERINN